MKIKKISSIFLFSLIFIACSNNQINTEDNSYNETIKPENINILEVQNFIANEPDPWEPFNRKMYYLNHQLEKFVVSPVINTYRYITPDFVEDRVTNFFKNTRVLNTLVNSTLQMKGRKSMKALGRLSINTILGLGGMFDVASKMGMPKPYEDFGLTLAHYGVGRGPYMVLPLFGPSYLRDGVGMAVDTGVSRYTDFYKSMELFNTNSIGMTTLKGVDKRKSVPFEYYGTSSPFEYEYVRYLYSKYRMLQEETRKEIF
ncbi:MlaA family lipoprotein [Fusobacterium massiliense]|uniref:MlaA family lipoprotein n=1 Tax=Fusobacterium massiliense TaxID=1852365 RepID=UPI0028D15540|nr:MlaA family lipoprotein [Fusobacterium massiliense]